MATIDPKRIIELALDAIERYIQAYKQTFTEGAFASGAKKAEDEKLDSSTLVKLWLEATKPIERAPEYEILKRSNALKELQTLIGGNQLNYFGQKPAIFAFNIKQLIAAWCKECEKAYADYNQRMADAERRRQEAAARARQDFLMTAGRDATLGFEVALDTKGHTLRLDEEIHIHAFLLGGSGSGKSNFIHAVLNEATRLYGPDSLQFYLMDFKEGVELNRYEQYPHVRALLVTQSDPSIGLEMLRDIQGLMRERNVKMRDAGCSTLKEYNASRSKASERLPRLVLIVDECHQLFLDNGGKAQQEINNIVGQIAKQGRSQGVHFIFSTQTLAGATIPPEVLNVVSDRYLLRTKASDAERLVDKSATEVEKLPQYGVFHYNLMDGSRETFVPSRMPREEMDAILEAALKKYADFRPDFTPFYFKGSRTSTLEETLGAISYRRRPQATLGVSTGLHGDPVGIKFKADEGQNLLILGNDRDLQGFRLLMDALASLYHWSAMTQSGTRFMAFINHDFEEEPEMEHYVKELRALGVEVADSRRSRSALLSELYQLVKADQPLERPVMVFMSSQDTYTELKRDERLEIATASAPAAPDDRAAKEANMFFGGNSLLAKASAKPSAQSTQSVTTSQAWQEILRRGPELGIYTTWQLRSLTKLMHSKYAPTYSSLTELFQHVAVLQTSNDVTSTLRISPSLKIDELSTDPDNLRALTVDLTTDEVETFVPFALPDIKKLKDLTNG